MHGVIHAAGVINDGPLLAKDPASIEEVFSAEDPRDAGAPRAVPGRRARLAGPVLLHQHGDGTGGPGRLRCRERVPERLCQEPPRRPDPCASRSTGASGARSAWRRPPWPSAPAIVPRRRPRTAGLPLLDAASFDANGARIFTATYAAGDALAPRRAPHRRRRCTGPRHRLSRARRRGARRPWRARCLRDPRLVLLAPARGSPTGPRAECGSGCAAADEGYEFELRSDCTFDGREAFELNAQASLALLPQPPRPDGSICAQIAGRCPDRRVAEGSAALRSPQEEHLNFGPRWRVLRNLAYGAGEGLAELRLAEQFAADIAEGYLLHPALLDLATGLGDGTDRRLSSRLTSGCPSPIDRCRVYGALPAEVFSWVRKSDASRADGPVATFDVTICDADGPMLMEVEGFSLRRLEADAGFGQSRRRRAPARSSSPTVEPARRSAVPGRRAAAA